MEKKRQSIDFKEIWNVQSDMSVTDNEWDQIFHNWDDPMKCEGRKKVTGCTICKALDEGHRVMRKSDGAIFQLIKEPDEQTTE